MPKYQLIAGLLLAGAVIAPGLAQTGAITYTPTQIIAARQASLEMSAVSFGYMQKSSKDGVEAKNLSFPADSLALWSKVLPTLFPAGTGEGQTSMETKAKAAVWSDRAGFDKAAANYVAQTAKLSALAEANDTAGFTAQLGEVKKACNACHETYKER